MAEKKATRHRDAAPMAKAKVASRAANQASAVEGQAKPTGQAKLVGAERLGAGDKLPDAALEDQQGKLFRLASLRGKLAVVYFYPRDDTPGCTREACAFQAELTRIARLGATVVGISPDPAARHAKFAEKYGLKFPLLVDTNRDFANACGVLVPKTLYGKTSIGIERSTFLVDSRGIVQRVWRKVRVDGHVEDVVAAVRALGTK